MDKEKRAFTNEWEFQKAIRMDDLDFESIEDINKYVEEVYKEN